MPDIESDMPFEVIEAAYEELGVDKLHDTIAEQEVKLADDQATMGAAATLLVAQLDKHPIALKLHAADDFHNAAIDYPETGQVAPDTQAEGMAKMHEATRLSWRERTGKQALQTRGIG